ncbi:MAG: carbonic anhydrase [Legionellaceae bacterium]
MFNKVIYSTLVILSLSSFQIAAETTLQSGKDQAFELLKKIEIQNKAYVEGHGKKFFAAKKMGQTPGVTMVGCSDSRVQSDAIDDSPEGNIFTIRNIGNQISTSKGSVKYGVNHLKSPLLMIIGHTDCGAIIAARGDYTTLETSIVKELDTLHVKKGQSILEATKDNVHQQVALALKTFADKVKKDELLVVGAIYDFSDEMKQGSGKLNIIDIQGKTVNQ